MNQAGQVIGVISEGDLLAKQALGAGEDTSPSLTRTSTWQASLAGPDVLPAFDRADEDISPGAGRSLGRTWTTRGRIREERRNA
jgi:hypothetical protein